MLNQIPIRAWRYQATNQEGEGATGTRPDYFVEGTLKKSADSSTYGRRKTTLPHESHPKKTTIRDLHNPLHAFRGHTNSAHAGGEGGGVSTKCVQMRAWGRGGVEPLRAH